MDVWQDIWRGIDWANVDPGALVLGGLSLLFVILVLLAIWRMAHGGLHAPEMDALEDGASEVDASEEAEPTTEDGEVLLPPTEPLELDDGAGSTPTPAEPDALGAGFTPPRTEPEPKPEPKPEPEPEPPPMRRGLAKTRKGFMARINDLLRGASLDEDLADELEAILVTSDIGVRTTERLLGDLRQELDRKEIKNAAVVRDRLRDRIKEIVARDQTSLSLDQTPTVIMVIGVNGVGKTTTIGKLAARWTQEGKKVVLAAGDTFRAAAVEQLEIWGQRSGAEVVRGPEGADPASVIYDAIVTARRTNADICICDTAGRLHTKVNLMEELKKVRRVMNKAMEGAPHEVLLVLDATTGQNAISQARQFKEAVEVNSIALTKLDGTAKGGVVVAICHDLDLPVRFIGIGEKVEDLRNFDPDEFVDALFADDVSEQNLQRAG